MNEGLIPRRYAKALYKVAVERGDADLLYAVMNRLNDACAAQPSLAAVVANPFVSVKDKSGLVTTAAGEGSDREEPERENAD